jgi:hypothetical protein
MFTFAAICGLLTVVFVCSGISAYRAGRNSAAHPIAACAVLSAALTAYAVRVLIINPNPAVWIWQPGVFVMW